MKILVSAFVADPYAGSEPNHGFNLPAGLAEAGHQVWCLCQSKARANIEAELKANPRPGLHFVYIDLPKWATRFYYNGVTMYGYYLAWQYKMARTAKALHKEVGFDVAHHVTWGSFQLSTGLSLLDIPFVFGPSGGGQIAPEAFASYFGAEWGKEKMRGRISELLLRTNPLLRKTMRKASRILLTNAETLELARRMGAADRAEIFEDPALPASMWPTELPARPHPGPELRLMWTGRLMPRKGIRFTLECLAQVDKAIPWTLTVLGDGPQGPQFKDWIREYGLEDRIIWRGRVPWAEVMAAYTSHDAFIYTTLRDSSPVQYLEAMACGLPLIVLNMHGAINFVPATCGLKAEVTTPAETAARMARLVEHFYHNPEQRPAMRQACRDWAYKYLWPQKIAKFEKVYKEMV